MEPGQITGVSETPGQSSTCPLGFQVMARPVPATQPLQLCHSELVSSFFGLVSRISADLPAHTPLSPPTPVLRTSAIAPASVGVLVACAQVGGPTQRGSAASELGKVGIAISCGKQLNNF